MRTDAADAGGGAAHHIGISTVTRRSRGRARHRADRLRAERVQLVRRDDDALIDELAAQGSPTSRTSRSAASPRCSPTSCAQVAARSAQTPQKVALAWLLRRSPNILFIPGTSRRAHLRENIAAAGLELGADHMRRLNGIAALV